MGVNPPDTYSSSSDDSCALSPSDKLPLNLSSGGVLLRLRLASRRASHLRSRDLLRDDILRRPNSSALSRSLRHLSGLYLLPGLRLRGGGESRRPRGSILLCLEGGERGRSLLLDGSRSMPLATDLSLLRDLGRLLLLGGGDLSRCLGGDLARSLADDLSLSLPGDLLEKNNNLRILYTLS